jgi:hypothetical protein
MAKTKIKEGEKSIVFCEKSANCPKMIYNYIDSTESVRATNETYDWIFDQVLKSDSWKNRNKKI